MRRSTFASRQSPTNRDLSQLLRHTVLVALLVLSARAGSQQTPSAFDRFTHKDYVAYLSALPTELRGTPEELQKKFGKIVAVAIALEKTGGWEADSGKQARELLSQYPEGLRYLGALRQLLGGATEGVSRFFEGTPPSYVGWEWATQVLREHGFGLAANVFTAVYMTGSLGIGNWQSPRAIEEGVRAWVQIPKGKRQRVDELLLKQLEANPERAAEVGRTALKVFLRPPVGEKSAPLPSHEFYALYLQLTNQTGRLSFETATELRQAGKREEARGMVRAIAEQNPSEAPIQNRVAKFLWFETGDVDGAEQVYRKAMQTVPEPSVRDVRVHYAKFLNWASKTQELDALAKSSDALAGEALLVTGKLAEAAALFRTEIRNPQSPIPNELAAWGGLLDADPASGLTEGKVLFAKLTPKDAVLWAGRQLWRAVSEEIPPPPRWDNPGRQKPGRPISEAPNWETQVAALMDRLLAVDAVACLRADPQTGIASLRYPAAVMYALANQPDKALEILKHRIEYRVDPPPGGWKGVPGTAPPADADKPYTVVSPNGDEPERLMVDLVGAIARCPVAADRTPPLSARVAAHLLHRVKPSERQEAIPQQAERLAEVVYQTVLALDPMPKGLRLDQPPPPPNPVDLKQFAPLEATVREALKEKSVATAAPQLLQGGLREALLSATNPQLLETLLNLAMAALDRYAEVCKDPKKVAGQAETLANYLEGRQVYDLKPYAKRLRDRYPTR